MPVHRWNADSEHRGNVGLPDAVSGHCLRHFLPLHPDRGFLAQCRRDPLLKRTRQRIRRGVFRSIADLQAAIKTYLAEYNASPKPFIWTKSAQAILAKLDRCAVPSI
jgi:hypothetical protein